MRPRFLPFFPTAALLAGLLSATLAASPGLERPGAGPAALDVSFASDVRPILERACTRCHGGLDEGKPRKEASLDLSTYEGLMFGSEYGEVVTPGDPEDSFIIEIIEAGDMPEEGDPLTSEEIATLRDWISEGARNN